MFKIREIDAFGLSLLIYEVWTDDIIKYYIQHCKSVLLIILRYVYNHALRMIKGFIYDSINSQKKKKLLVSK